MQLGDHNTICKKCTNVDNDWEQFKHKPLTISFHFNTGNNCLAPHLQKVNICKSEKCKLYHELYPQERIKEQLH